MLMKNKLKNISNINHTESNLRLKEAQNKPIILKNITYQNNSLSLINLINKKHFKFNSMKIADFYKNNIRKKNNTKMTNLNKKINNESNINELGNSSINKIGTINNPTLLQKHIISITHHNNINKIKKNMRKSNNENKNKSQINQVKQLSNMKDNIHK